MIQVSRQTLEASQSVYTFPYWLVEDLGFRNKFSRREFAKFCQAVHQSRCDKAMIGKFAELSCSVFVKLSGSRLPQITVTDSQSGKSISDAVLREILLQVKLKSLWRRKLMMAIANMALTQQQSSCRDDHLDKSWLKKILNDPVTAEEEMIQLWNEFVAECQVPSSFLIPSRSPLSLRDLIILRRGSGERNHRQSFAENFPWVARSILTNSDNPDEVFKAIDDNPQGSKAVAAKYICCSNDPDCEKAVSFANRAARYRHHGALDILLGDHQSLSEANRNRAVFLKAYSEDPELISHIGDEVQRTRQQISRAIEVLFAYMHYVSRDGFDCAYSLAGLLVRIMVRNEYEPADDQFSPEEIVTGLAAVSADALSAFVAKHLKNPTEISLDASTLDIGVLAFLYYIGGKNRPRLTMNQLLKFVIRAGIHSRHELTLINSFPENSWPTPAGWNSAFEDETYVEGVKIKCLTDAKRMFEEGLRMGNCLREGRYQRAALLGQLALFSIEAQDGKATLALKAIVEEIDDDTTILTCWEKYQLRGWENTEPSLSCLNAADILLRDLQKHCPIRIAQKEIARRQRIQQRLDAHRFNADTTEAKERWFDIYTNFLPRCFSKIGPETIVTNFLTNSPQRR